MSERARNFVVVPPAPAQRCVALEASEFLAMKIPPRTSLVHPILPSQGLMQIYAARGGCKTHLAMAIAVAGVTATQILSWRVPRAFGVLYIDGEMPAAALQERVAAAIATAGAELRAPLRILTPDLQPAGTPNLADPDWQSALNPLLEGIELVIVDNISTLVRDAGDENDAESWSAVQSWALRMRSSGRSVLFVHHAGKNGDQRGSSRREDVLDTVIKLSRPKNYCATAGAHFELEFTKARGFYGTDAEPLDVKLETLRDGRLEWTYRKLDAVKTDDILDMKRNGMSVRDIERETGMSRSSVQRRIDSAKGAKS